MAAWGTPGRTAYEVSRLRLVLVGAFLASIACIGIAVVLWQQ